MIYVMSSPCTERPQLPLWNIGNASVPALCLSLPSLFGYYDPSEELHPFPPASFITRPK